MKKSVTGGTLQTGEGGLSILGGVFLLGAVAGSLCCVKLPNLQTMLQGDPQTPLTLWRALLPELGFLAAILLAGFMRQGAFLTWGTMAVKGFLLSASSTAQVLRQGNAGYPLTAAQILLPQLFAVAALVLLGRQAVGWSALRMRLPAGKGRRSLPDSTYFLTAAICAVLLLLSALLRVRVSPALEAAVQHLLPSA